MTDSAVNELQVQIDQWSKEIYTDNYSMSIGELMNLYENAEIDLHPEFQRFFRWTPTQKSRLIESILLGIPIPSIFVSQRQDGVLDVVDGLQRVSTVLEFAGLLRDEDGELRPPIECEKTRYLPALEHKVWEPTDHLPDAVSFTNAQRLMVKRSKLTVVMIKYQSDSSTKYELFQRLNTGGSDLSEQEVRNCLLIMVNRDFYKWLLALSETAEYSTILALTERKELERYDLELVVRFIVMQHFPPDQFRGLGDVSEFLTEKSIECAEHTSFPYSSYEARFRRVVALLARTTGDSSFIPYRPDRDSFAGSFSVAAFETITYGLSLHLEEWESLDENEASERLTAVIKDMWRDQEGWRRRTGTGIRAEYRLPVVINYATERFKL